MMNVPLADASGAVVISKKKFDTLASRHAGNSDPERQEVHGDSDAKSREENAAAIQTMKRNGVQIIEVADPKTLQDFDATGKKARQSLVGQAV